MYNNTLFYRPTEYLGPAYWAHSSNLYLPSVHLKKYQLGPYYIGIKLFNTLPPFLKNESHNPVRFRSLLKKFLLNTTLYSLDEFYSICKPGKP